MTHPSRSTDAPALVCRQSGPHWKALVALALAAGLGLSLGGCASGTMGKLRGGVEVRDEQLAAVRPGEGPRMVYVADFALDGANVETDQGVQGALPGQGQRLEERGGILGRLAQRLPHPLSSGAASDRAREIVDGMAAALVESLSEKGMPARRIAGGGSLPQDGWLIQGMFTEVDEGSRIKRAVIGFGQGATAMDVQVAVSDLAGKEPTKPFIAFGTLKDPGKMPGAVVSMNPYVAAAKFVMEKNATGKDIKMTADRIVDEILKYRRQFEDEAKANRPR